MGLRWHFDEFSARRIAGWVDHDGHPAPIAISVNGRVIATGTPTEYRDDLKRAGIADGRRSFTFPISGYLIAQTNVVAVACDQNVLRSEVLRPLSEESRIAAIHRASGFE